jgi:hypothetical protein
MFWPKLNIHVLKEGQWGEVFASVGGVPAVSEKKW